MRVVPQVSVSDETWLLAHFEKDYELVTPTSAGRSRGVEGHDVCILISRSAFRVLHRAVLRLPSSRMARYLLRVRVLSRATGKRLTFATSHFDAGATDEMVPDLVARTKGETYGRVRRAMLQEACETLAAEQGDGVVFAGDFNLRDSEVPAQGLGEH